MRDAAVLTGCGRVCPAGMGSRWRSKREQRLARRVMTSRGGGRTRPTDMPAGHAWCGDSVGSDAEQDERAPGRGPPDQGPAHGAAAGVQPRTGGVRVLVEQAIGQLADAWALRRWRGLLHRVRNVFRAPGALVCLAGGSTESRHKSIADTLIDDGGLLVGWWGAGEELHRHDLTARQPHPLAGRIRPFEPVALGPSSPELLAGSRAIHCRCWSVSGTGPPRARARRSHAWSGSMPSNRSRAAASSEARPIPNRQWVTTCWPRRSRSVTARRTGRTLRRSGTPRSAMGIQTNSSPACAAAVASPVKPTSSSSALGSAQTRTSTPSRRSAWSSSSSQSPPRGLAIVLSRPGPCRWTVYRVGRIEAMVVISDGKISWRQQRAAVVELLPLFYRPAPDVPGRYRKSTTSEGQFLQLRADVAGPRRMPADAGLLTRKPLTSQGVHGFESHPCRL